MWVHLNQHALHGVDINLQPARLVQRRVEQGQEALMGDVRPGVRDVTTRLGEDALMVVAVEQRVFRLALAPVARVPGLTDLVRLKARLFEYDEKPAGPVRRRYSTRDMRLHRDHRRIDARHASRTTARQGSCRPRRNRLVLLGAFMST